MKIMELEEAKPFLSPVDLKKEPDYSKIIAYPIDLSIIKARVENHFYRRLSAIKFDIKMLFENTKKYFNDCDKNRLHEQIIQDSFNINHLCLQLINGSELILNPNVLNSFHNEKFPQEKTNPQIPFSDCNDDKSLNSSDAFNDTDNGLNLTQSSDTSSSQANSSQDDFVIIIFLLLMILILICI